MERPQLMSTQPRCTTTCPTLYLHCKPYFQGGAQDRELDGAEPLKDVVGPVGLRRRRPSRTGGAKRGRGGPALRPLRVSRIQGRDSIENTFGLRNGQFYFVSVTCQKSSLNYPILNLFLV